MANATMMDLLTMPGTDHLGELNRLRRWSARKSRTRYEAMAREQAKMNGAYLAAQKAKKREI